MKVHVLTKDTLADRRESNACIYTHVIANDPEIRFAPVGDTPTPTHLVVQTGNRTVNYPWHNIERWEITP